jgi:hypothetical protein
MVSLVGFVSLYVYAWIVNSNPWSSNMTICHSNPVTVTNYPSKKTCFFYPHRVRIALEKSGVHDMRGCNLVFFNQDVPYELNAMFLFDDGDETTNKVYCHGYGMMLSSIKHSVRMLDCANDDRTSVILCMVWGIYFCDINHTVNKERGWWTFLINLWYPIILFGILPTIFVVKKLRNWKSTSFQKPTGEK